LPVRVQFVLSLVISAFFMVEMVNRYVRTGTG
jgi:hypothetical protein